MKELLELLSCCILFTVWVLGSGCENPFSLSRDKGEGCKGALPRATSQGTLTVRVTHCCQMCISLLYFHPLKVSEWSWTV